MFLSLIVFALSICTVSLANAAGVVVENPAIEITNMNLQTELNATGEKLAVTAHSAEAVNLNVGVLSGAATAAAAPSDSDLFNHATGNAERCTSYCLMIGGVVETVPKVAL